MAQEIEEPEVGAVYERDDSRRLVDELVCPTRLGVQWHGDLYPLSQGGSLAARYGVVVMSASTMQTRNVATMGQKSQAGLIDAEKVPEWIKFACDRVGFTGFEMQIQVLWNNRFTRKLGDASWRLRIIRLSVPLWPLMTTEQRRDTVIHETCHVLCGNLCVEKKAHGPNWQAFMRKCGLKPSRTANLNRGKLRRRHKRVRVYCKCVEDRFVPKGKRTKMLNGTAYYTCLVCGETISPVPTLAFELAKKARQG